ncbi:MAG TPA: bifunctional riboflavin kinase/FAD synthetase [Acidimicrobiia bacterium]|nr:bifunctional riboflavin kinase/FAD synthetase [Acidimicrobiia bacterium]
MRVLSGSPVDWHPGDERRAVAIGVFDGVHRGHQAVLSAMVEAATGAGLVAAVLTFDPHPRSVVAPQRAPRLLTTVGQRVGLLGDLGVEVVAVAPFDDRVRLLAPEAFATELLVDGLGAVSVTVGSDFRFGNDRTGDAGTLEQLGESLGFAVSVVSLVGGDEPVSSSQIRRLVADGEVTAAADALGRPHEVVGRVVPGDGRGRGIGVPTANIDLPPMLAVPGRGVYAVTASTDGLEWLPGVANIGVRPTFGGDAERLEVHLLDTDLDLYGRELRVRFIARIREERTFDGVELLVAQIRDDVEAARSLLA